MLPPSADLRRSAPSCACESAPHKVTLANLATAAKLAYFSNDMLSYKAQVVTVHLFMHSRFSCVNPSLNPFHVAAQEAYKLMCQVAPDVAEYERGIATLQAEIRTRKASIANKEAALAAANPPLFRQVQVEPMLVVHLQIPVRGAEGTLTFGRWVGQKLDVRPDIEAEHL